MAKEEKIELYFNTNVVAVLKEERLIQDLRLEDMCKIYNLMLKMGHERLPVVFSKVSLPERNKEELKYIFENVFDSELRLRIFHKLLSLVDNNIENLKVSFAFNTLKFLYDENLSDFFVEKYKKDYGESAFDEDQPVEPKYEILKKLSKLSKGNDYLKVEFLLFKKEKGVISDEEFQKSLMEIDSNTEVPDVKICALAAIYNYLEINDLYNHEDYEYVAGRLLFLIYNSSSDFDYTDTALECIKVNTNIGLNLKLKKLGIR